MLTRWEIHTGLVPVIVFGYRAYKNDDICTIEHVFYLGVIDICLTLYYDC